MTTAQPTDPEAGTPAPTTPTPPATAADPPPPPRTGWDFAIIVVVLAALVGGMVFIVQHYTASSDASAVLGIFIPSLTAIGGAVFGVSIGYSTGNTAGHARGAAGKSAAVQAAKAQAAAAIAPHVSRSRDAVNKVAESLARSLPSPAGARAFKLEAGQSVTQPIEIDAEALAQAQNGLEHLDGLVAGMQQ